MLRGLGEGAGGAPFFVRWVVRWVFGWLVNCSLLYLKYDTAMSKDFGLFTDILFLDLSPWKVKLAEAKFLEMLHDIEKENYQYQPLYDVAFLKPLNAKKRYYHAKIEGEAISLFNRIHRQMELSDHEDERAYLFDTILHKRLEQALRDVDKIIRQRLLSFEDIRLAGDDVYIMHYLKYQLVRLYLEVQDGYRGLVDGEPLTAEEIFIKYFGETGPMEGVIVEAGRINLPKPKSNRSLEPEAQIFIALKREIREAKKSVLRYDEIIFSPDRFAVFEEQLFDHELIDKDYNFNNKHGQLRELAAAYHAAIKNGYFNKQLNKNKAITALHIRKFLDHRYNASLDKQFRTWANKKDELNEFIDNNSNWLK